MQYINGSTNLTEKSSIYSDEMGWWETPMKCDCGRPLHLTSGGNMPFCPLCCKKRELAIKARTALVVAITRYNTLAAALEQMHEEAIRLNSSGTFASGMPL